MSDMIELRNHLCDNGWSTTTLVAESDVPRGVEISSSLDSYLVSGAIQGSDRLPSFPDVRCSLDHWPDLAAAEGAEGAVRVAALLTRGAYSPRDVAAATGMAAREVSAYFWAFDAAGILQRDVEETAVPEQPVSTPRAGMWTRIAKTFGLG
jgi:hypothetical protein